VRRTRPAAVRMGGGSDPGAAMHTRSGESKIVDMSTDSGALSGISQEEAPKITLIGDQVRPIGQSDQDQRRGAWLTVGGR
jgi:hypothetical protein